MKIEKAIKNVALIDPVLYFLLMNCNINVVKGSQVSIGKMTINIGESITEDQDRLAWVLTKAVMAVYLRHKERTEAMMKSYGRGVKTICDVVSNVVTEAYINAVRNRTEPNMSVSFEKLVEEFLQSGKGGGGGGGRNEVEYRISDETEVVKQQINKGTEMKEEEILHVVSGIGRGKLWFEKLYQTATRRKVDISEVLARTLKRGAEFRSDWKRLNRKYDDYAGRRRIGKPKLIIAVDTSGSISDAEYKRFVEVINGFSDEYDLTLMQWDDGITTIVEFPRAEDWQVRKSIGGTDITEVAGWAKDNTEEDDVLVVLSDGYISGLESLDEVSCRKVLITTKAEADGFDEVIHLD